MNRRSVIIIVLVLVVAAVGIYAWKEYHREPGGVEGEAPDFTLTTSELIGAFEADSAAASKKFIDKILLLSGTLKSFDTSGVILLGEPGEMSSVQCSMDGRRQTDYTALKEGSVLQIKGKCTGYQTDDLLGTDVILNYCVLSEK